MNAIDSAWNYGKTIGSQMLRLHLRDLAHENMRTVIGSNGSGIYVPLRAFLNNEISQQSLVTLGKRIRCCTNCSRKSKRLALSGFQPKRKRRKVLRFEHGLLENDKTMNLSWYGSWNEETASDSLNTRGDYTIMLCSYLYLHL